MIPKGPKCVGCVAYGDGRGFVPDQIVEGSEVFIMGQMPGPEEEAQGIPYVGKTGQAMDHKYLHYAGLTREQVSVGNVLRCRWGHNEAKLPPVESVQVRAAITHCERAWCRGRYSRRRRPGPR